MTSDEVIDHAIITLKATGWCQKRSKNEADERCLLGALGSSWNWKEGMDEAATNEALILYEAAKDRVREVVGPNLISWNDTPGRTKDEVVAALEEARLLKLLTT